MSKPKTGRTPEHIGTIVSRLLRHQRSEKTVDLDRLWDNWAGVVGDAVAANTRPQAIKGRILLVYVSSSVWVHQLQFLRAEMIANINQFLDSERIGDIKFKIGPTGSSFPPPGDG
jgi:predicted nucleic acid-binding Zn ribbon protein